MNTRASADFFEFALQQGAVIERLTTLAWEYHEKAITPERFAARTYEILAAHDKQAHEKLDGADTRAKGDA